MVTKVRIGMLNALADSSAGDLLEVQADCAIGTIPNDNLSQQDIDVTENYIPMRH